MLLLIDNYDSFTYNLYQYIAELSDAEIVVVRNNQITIDLVKKQKPSHIILSPGPKTPKDAGICVPLIQSLYKEIPIFGICLGHQSIIEAFGGTVRKTPNVMHGKTSNIHITHSSKLYKGFPKQFTATRYHSLIGERTSLPNSLSVIAELQDKTIMGIEHKQFPVFGCQYHPESILTEFGKEHFKNFLSI